MKATGTFMDETDKILRRQGRALTAGRVFLPAGDNFGETKSWSVQDEQK